jgi:hypothetical protein
MQSHTVPRKLLEQFAYDDPFTHSKRLWRYRKGQAPWPKASPRTATRRDRHFADPANAAKEAELEARLKREFEDPVNEFIGMIGFRTFLFTPASVRALTGYLTMLFNRSLARRGASQQHANIMIEALRSLLNDEQRLARLIGKYTMDVIDRRLALRMVTREEVVATIENTIAKHSSAEEAQRLYVQSVETMMDFADEGMLNGHWGVLRAQPDQPFVIGDAPVVTWERSDDNMLHFGLGFARPNVEAFLPVSPTACLHVLPRVQRTRPLLAPSVVEVNMAQAALATEHCFTSVGSAEIDAIMQRHLGTIRIGIEGFSVRHIDYKGLMFDILMGRHP